MEINLTEIIIALISLVLVPMITWGLAELSKLLSAKTAAIQDRAARDALIHLLQDAQDNIRAAVEETAQTYVDGVKGTPGWDAAAQAEAFERAKHRFVQLMGDTGMAALEDAISDVNAWMIAKIEESVRYGKAGS